MKKGYVDVYIVVTESVFLMLEPDSKVKKHICRLVAMASLASIESVRRNAEKPNLVNFIWRKIDDRD